MPQPTTAEETFDFFKGNFERHYLDNRAPFPLFLHEAWLKDEQRFKGYFNFLDWLLEKDDVFVVSIQEVLDWMQHPRSAQDYEPRSCVTQAKKTRCMSRPFYNGKLCEFRGIRQLGNETRYMSVCGSKCPRHYPWVDNPQGF